MKNIVQKLNYMTVSRSLIALLFVIAGYQKISNFKQTVMAIGGMGVPLASLAALLVVLIEIPIAISFAAGYKVKETGYTLIGFTILVTIIVHMVGASAGSGGQIDTVNVLKNIAIVGGIFAAIGYACKDCEVHHKNKHNTN